MKKGVYMNDLQGKYQVLLNYLKELGSVAIAFSGGVDSTFLLAAAKEALGDNVIALTAKSCLFPESESGEAEEFCGQRRTGGQLYGDFRAADDARDVLHGCPGHVRPRAHAQRNQREGHVHLDGVIIFNISRIIVIGDDGLNPGVAPGDGIGRFVPDFLRVLRNACGLVRPPGHQRREVRRPGSVRAAVHSQPRCLGGAVQHPQLRFLRHIQRRELVGGAVQPPQLRVLREIHMEKPSVFCMQRSQEL